MALTVYIWQIDFILPYVCTVINHGWRFLFFSRYGIFPDLFTVHTHGKMYTSIKSVKNKVKIGKKYVLLLCDVIRDLYSISINFEVTIAFLAIWLVTQLDSHAGESHWLTSDYNIFSK